MTKETKGETIFTVFILICVCISCIATICIDEKKRAKDKAILDATYNIGYEDGVKETIEKYNIDTIEFNKAKNF